MEFNNNINTTPIIKEDFNSSNKDDLKILLKSTGVLNTSSIKDAVKVEVSVLNNETLLISHDLSNIYNLFDEDSINKSLISIHGRNGRLFMSSKKIEASEISMSQSPIIIKYELEVNNNGIDAIYEGSKLVGNLPGVSYLTLVGQSSSSVSEVTVPEAVSKIDNDLASIKNTLSNFANVYDKSQNKVVSLPELINNLTVLVDNLTLRLEDVEKEIKDLQRV